MAANRAFWGTPLAPLPGIPPRAKRVHLAGELGALALGPRAQFRVDVALVGVPRAQSLVGPTPAARVDIRALLATAVHLDAERPCVEAGLGARIVPDVDLLRDARAVIVGEEGNDVGLPRGGEAEAGQEDGGWTHCALCVCVCVCLES